MEGGQGGVRFHPPIADLMIGLWHLPKYLHVRQVNLISYGSSWVWRTLYTTTPVCQSAPLVWVGIQLPNHTL